MSLEEIKTIFDCLPLSCILLNTDYPYFTIAGINKEYEKVTFCDSGQLIGLPFFEAFPTGPDHDETRESLIKRAFNHVVQTQTLHHIEKYKYTIAKNDAENKLQYCKVDTYPLFNRSGEMIYIIQSYADITLLHHAVQEVSVKEERVTKVFDSRFKRLLQEGSDYIAVIDSNGNYMFASPNTEKLFHVSIDDLIGKNVFDLLPEKDRDWHLDNFKRVKREKRIELKPYRFTRFNGEEIWLETTLTDRTDDKIIGGVVANTKNVTQRMLSELKNQEHLQRFNMVSKATSDAIWDYNMLTGEVIWNANMKTLFGYDSPKSDYDWWSSNVHPDDIRRVTDLIADKLASKEDRWKIEYRFRCADGSYKFVLDRGSLLFNDSGSAIRTIGSMQDVTDKLNYISEIEQHNTRLKDIAWAQSHLVRAPLARILGIVQLLVDPTTDQDTQETLLTYLDISATELDEVIKNIIDKSQPL